MVSVMSVWCVFGWFWDYPGYLCSLIEAKFRTKEILIAHSMPGSTLHALNI